MKLTRICPRCKIEYPFTTEYFYRRGHRSKKTGEPFLNHYCIKCQKEIGETYREKNREKINKFSREHYEQYKPTQQKYKSLHQKELKTFLKKWRKENKEKIQQQTKKWVKEHKEERRLWTNQYTKERYRKDIGYRLMRIMRGRVAKKLKSQNVRKSEKTINLLGCSIKELKLYLESKFLSGMSWKNYGENGWHLDHIKPCSSFDLSNPEQQKICFHYTNLQPLWEQDNMNKSSIYNGKRYRGGKAVD